MFELDQARRFIHALTGSASSPVTFQVYYDPKKPYPKRPELANTWKASLDDSLEYLTYSQSQLCGVHVALNDIDAVDGQHRDTRGVTNIRTMVVDFDGSQEPEWDLPPHFVQKRDETHGHAFWLLSDAPVDADVWSETQKRLAITYGADEQIIGTNHTIRAPGFVHYKDPNAPQMYRITVDRIDELPRYAIGDIISAHPLDGSDKDRFDQWIARREGVTDGDGYEHNDYELRKFIEFTSFAAYPAVEGSGTHEVIRVAGYGHDHGIPLEEAQELMWEHYNPRCEPPWQDWERSHFYDCIYRAYTNATSAPGCKTYKAEFKRMELPEPVCGWDNQREHLGLTEEPVNEPFILDADEFKSALNVGENRLDEQQGLMILASINGNSNHYDIARAFDGVSYHGKHLMRFNKQFYRYTGRSWCEIDDELIRSQIQNSLSSHKPANKLTTGVFQCLCDLVTIEQVEIGQWLGEDDVDTSNLVSFRNGLVDLSEATPTVRPHDHQFFNFTELPYSYVTGETCPQWEAFLSSIWDDNAIMKRQLQQWMGYCLTRDTSLQKFGIFMGVPRGGKGVITDIISTMIGEANTSSPSLSNLVKDSTLDKMSTSAIALIPDAHSVNISVRDAVLSNLKAITGEDSIGFHRMYKGSVSTKFSTKIIMSTNNVPDFNDPSGALVQRMLIFPFFRSFASKPDTTLRSRLHNEIEGILQWAIAGLRDLRANGGKFVEAQEGLVEKEDIKADMFPLAQFVNEICELEDNAFTLVEDLYNGYRIWSVSNGIKSPMSLISFKKCLRNSALPITHERSGKSVGFRGITVNAVAKNNVIGFPPIKQL